MDIKPIEKTNVGDQVYEQLLSLLIEGKWKQGEKLPSENEMARLFHVSRVTIREAYHKLSVLGLIETRLGEGSFVKKIDESENMNALIPYLYLDDGSNLQIMEFREIIETEAVGLAAERAEERDLEELEEIYQGMKKSYDNKDWKEFASRDLEFHMKICECSKNIYLYQTNRILERILIVSMENVIRKMGGTPALKYHRMILDAITNRDKIEAKRIMKEHIRNNNLYFIENDM